ncbi:polysaccharide deacetylase [Syntrophomonas wolfei subsp. wolfei str. Goettingen G311]|uniref:Polysaccharide deacetylase n=1 Tax=Syntrophomonas wolfei subsp. wolfei (strain DSM 2245B / Goettingen) TaxID=335541 RepID=Q0AY25_SYNWW|nr:polysaccharide deacetylase [Syntrophomonas wolfei subsp. wolfei str. Goettingen G311]
MFFVLQRRSVGFFLGGILFLGISLGAYNLALHPNMHNWKAQKLVITDVKTTEKAVALTFDDGPDPVNTPVVLDMLKKHQAQATFFVVGIRAEKQSDLLQRMANEGHEIGNHSYSHADFNHKKKEFYQEEIRKTNALIERISGQKSKLFRPPGGYLSYDMVEVTQKEKVTIAYWTYQQDSKDWQGNNSSQIAAHIIKNIKPGQIIILHDGYKNGLETARAVDKLIPELKQQGYRFLTMSDLMLLEKQE